MAAAADVTPPPIPAADGVAQPELIHTTQHPPPAGTRSQRSSAAAGRLSSGACRRQDCCCAPPGAASVCSSSTRCPCSPMGRRTCWSAGAQPLCGFQAAPLLGGGHVAQAAFGSCSAAAQVPRTPIAQDSLRVGSLGEAGGLYTQCSSNSVNFSQLQELERTSVVHCLLAREMPGAPWRQVTQW